ncbi:hypothetical protein ZHAS_00020683 [Anopheles sinensis]|uniref:Uncharacterized protein n=1 Tax=Anopheles sinensis TaxID=74873 RepID=A0A084WQE1_ANOSI|nr:hypothetical protein ZHAS_00020683 [Anopheles sinensis]
MGKNAAKEGFVGGEVSGERRWDVKNGQRRWTMENGSASDQTCTALDVGRCRPAWWTYVCVFVCVCQ